MEKSAVYERISLKDDLTYDSRVDQPLLMELRDAKFAVCLDLKEIFHQV